MIDDCDIQIIYNTGALTLTKTTSDMIGSQFQKPDHQLTDADGQDLNVAGVCNTYACQQEYPY